MLNRLGEFSIDGGWSELWGLIDTSVIGLTVYAVIGAIATLIGMGV